MNHRQYRRGTALAAALAVWLAAAAIAQDTNQPQSPLNKLQGQPVLTEDDINTIGGWITQQVEAVVKSGAPKAAADLRTEYKGTAAFKEAYVRKCLELIGPVYKRAPLNAATQLFTVINALKAPSTIDLLLEALGDERVAVRTAAAVGLRNLHGAIAGDSALLGRTLTALRDAGKRETAPVALKEIYMALDFTGATPADPKAVAAAVLDLLVTRAQQYAADKANAWGADDHGLAEIARLRGSLDDADKNRLTQAVARILQASVVRYHNELGKYQDNKAAQIDLDRRDGTERMIVEAEKLLVAQLNPSGQRPDITTRMKEGKTLEMKIAWNQWADLLQNAIGEDFHADTSSDEADADSDSEKDDDTP